MMIHFTRVDSVTGEREKRSKIESKIDKLLAMKEKRSVIVKGKVLKIQSKNIDGRIVDIGVWLDLCGVGIPGFIYVGNWKKTFTETLRKETAYGDIVNVMVLRKVERKNGMYYYSCSRKKLVEDYCRANI